MDAVNQGLFVHSNLICTVSAKKKVSDGFRVLKSIP